MVTAVWGVAQKLRVKLQPVEVQDPPGFDSVFESMSAERAQALVVVVDPLAARYQGRIAELAAKNRLPAVYGFVHNLAQRIGRSSSKPSKIVQMKAAYDRLPIRKYLQPLLNDVVP